MFNNKMTFIFLIFLSPILVLGQEMTQREIADLAKIDAARKAAEANIAQSKAENRAWADTLRAYGSRVAEGFKSTYTDAGDLLTRVKTAGTVLSTDTGVVEPKALADLKTSAEKARDAQGLSDKARDKAIAQHAIATESSAKAFQATNTMMSENLSAAASVALTKAKSAAFDTWMATTGSLQSDINKLNATAWNLNEARILLDRKLDNSLISAYMQSKMALLMGSDVVCKAVSSCKNGKNSSGIKPVELDSVFPNRAAEQKSTFSSSQPASSGAK